MGDREAGNLTGRMTAGRQLKEVEEDGDAAEAEAEAEEEEDNGLNGGKAKAIANYPPHTQRRCKRTATTICHVVFPSSDWSVKS